MTAPRLALPAAAALLAACAPTSGPTATPPPDRPAEAVAALVPAAASAPRGERAADRSKKRTPLQRKKYRLRLLAKADHPAWQQSIRRCIIARESGGNPRAKNPSSTASGLYQFLDGTFVGVTKLPAPARAYSRKVQTGAFWRLFDDGRGRGHWSYPPKECW